MADYSHNSHNFSNGGVISTVGPSVAFKIAGVLHTADIVVEDEDSAYIENLEAFIGGKWVNVDYLLEAFYDQIFAYAEPHIPAAIEDYAREGFREPDNEPFYDPSDKF